MSQSALPIRNIAIIAHVDHGKTTLVDFLLKQSGTFREDLEMVDRLMDSMDLEKERGITITSKNASFTYKGTKVNIIDTPGHSDFGGEVERVLDMVDGAILLVDASEGPLPQTRFVLDKALKKNIQIITCVNKVDRPDSRVDEVEGEIFELLAELGAREDQIDLDNTVYAIAKEGRASLELDKVVETDNMTCLFDLIINKIPAPRGDENGPIQLLVSNIDYNKYVGGLVIGRLISGTLKIDQSVMISQKNNQFNKFKITALFSYQGNKQVKVDKVSAGDIAIIAGCDSFTIGDSVVDIENPQPLPRIEIEAPTVAVVLSVNDSPFKGLDGDKLTSRKIKERLDNELLRNVSLGIEDTESTDAWKIMGRGELQLCILFEQMRREGFEFLVSKPVTILKQIDGKLMEPMEDAFVDIEKDHMGIITESLSERKGIVQNISNMGENRTRLTVRIPSRGLIGYRSKFLTHTRGTGLLNSQFIDYEPYKGEIQSRNTGVIVSDRKGVATAYALNTLESRGSLFIGPKTEVYMGMVVGESAKGLEISVNVTKEKKLSNVRSSGTDDAIKLSPVKKFNLEKVMEWVSDEELIEVTPKHIRVRCRELDPNKKKRKSTS